MGSKLSPKPTFFIFNQGLWGGLTEFMKPEFRKALIEAIRDAGMISVYKTTTAQRFKTHPSPPRDYEVEFCNMADKCFNTSWTHKVPVEMYWDAVHFMEPVYSLLNMQLLELLSEPVVNSDLEII